MGNKTITYILSVLFIITFSLGVIGYLNRDSVKDEPKPTPSSNVSIVQFSGEQKEIPSFAEKISAFDFVKANKDYYSGYISIKIENNQVKVEVQKDGILASTESTPATVPYTITDIATPVAVQGLMANDENNTISVYTLDSNGNLYLSEFFANPAAHTGIKTSKLGIDNVDSFSVMNINLTEDFIINQNYVVLKTTDGTYYTDHKFSADAEYKITRIVDLAIPEVSTSEEVVEDGSIGIEETNEEITEIEENVVEENTETENQEVVETNEESTNVVEPQEPENMPQ